MNRNSVSFLFYSNKSFETSPFIIYFKIEVPEYFEEEEDSVVLTYIFLAAIIGFIALAVGGIIVVRKCSIFFNLKKNKNDSYINNENLNQVKGDLSIISEKNVEENSVNEMEIDLQELKTIKGNCIEQDKNINDNKDKK